MNLHFACIHLEKLITYPIGLLCLDTIHIADSMPEKSVCLQSENSLSLVNILEKTKCPNCALSVTIEHNARLATRCSMYHVTTNIKAPFWLFNVLWCI